jgi:hypothetical protein
MGLTENDVINKIGYKQIHPVEALGHLESICNNKTRKVIRQMAKEIKNDLIISEEQKKVIDDIMIKYCNQTY